jgi:small-conductance mechanosensitive channel
MENPWNFEVTDFLHFGMVATAIRVALLLGVGFPLVYLLSKWIRRSIAREYSTHRGMILGKIAFYSGTALLLVSVLNELDFSLAPLLGAAGIAGIALGFASQTSVSNIISGLFLITEEPFVVGDVISIGDTTGEVLSIDLLSVKLRTFNNRFVRIPNETIIKSQVTNITRFPIRRLDIDISVAYKEDIGRVHDALLEVALHNPLALKEPEPLIIFSKFGSSSIDLLFAVWGAKSDYLQLKNSIHQEIKTRFDEDGIEIPFPHLSLYTGSATRPLPVQLIRE